MALQCGPVQLGAGQQEPSWGRVSHRHVVLRWRRRPLPGKAPGEGWPRRRVLGAGCSHPFAEDPSPGESFLETGSGGDKHDVPWVVTRFQQ